MVDAIIRTKLEGWVGDSLDSGAKGIGEPTILRRCLFVAEWGCAPHQTEESSLSSSRQAIKMNDDLTPLEAHPGNRSIEESGKLFARGSVRKVGEVDLQRGMDADRSNGLWI